MMLTELLARPLQLADAATMQVATAGGGGPVDLDITALIYLVIFLVAWFALKALIFDPWVKVRDARAAGTEGSRAEADEMKATADAKLAEYKEALSTARAEAAEARNTLRVQGTRQETEIVGTARTAATEKLAKNREAVQAQVEGARAELKAEAQRLGAAMAETLMPS